MNEPMSTFTVEEVFGELQQEAQQAIEHLAFGLHQRGLLEDAKHAKAGRVVAVALEELTAQAEALEEWRADQQPSYDGLTTEQEIRDRALDRATTAIGKIFIKDTDARLDMPAKVVAAVLEIAQGFEAYIRDGVRVSAEERSDDIKDLGGLK